MNDFVLRMNLDPMKHLEQVRVRMAKWGKRLLGRLHAQSLMNSLWFAFSFLVFLQTSASAADPWRMAVRKDEMANTSTPIATADVHSDAGHAFNFTATCDPAPGFRSIALHVVAPHADFEIFERTTLNGNDWVGYSADTYRTVNVRIKFDENAMKVVSTPPDHSNSFNLIFPNTQQMKTGMESIESTSKVDAMTEVFFKGVFGFAAMAYGAGDVSGLMTSQVLKIQPTLSDGQTPIVRVPLSEPFKAFVRKCISPEDAAGQPTRAVPTQMVPAMGTEAKAVAPVTDPGGAAKSSASERDSAVIAAATPSISAVQPGASRAPVEALAALPDIKKQCDRPWDVPIRMVATQLARETLLQLRATVKTRTVCYRPEPIDSANAPGTLKVEGKHARIHLKVRQYPKDASDKYCRAGTPVVLSVGNIPTNVKRMTLTVTDETCGDALTFTNFKTLQSARRKAKEMNARFDRSR